MHIVNIMFSRGNGGIEQAFVDYCEGLHNRGHQVTAFVYPGAAVHQQLLKLSIPVIAMRNFSEWDIFAAARLRKRLLQLAPDAIIAHGNRAWSLAHWANRGKFHLVAVAHNYNTRRFSKAKTIFAITRDLMQHLIKQGVPEERIFHVPNMIRCHELPQRNIRNSPPVIGAMGRFVAKKGFNVYIEALRQLKERGYRFQAILGGEGGEGPALRKQAASGGLENILTFPGWIQDKKQFYTYIDIFCLPSLHEPFGIVLLEAFVFGAAVVATDSEGPRDIITSNYDALIVPMDDAAKLADALAKLLDDEKLANDLAANAFVKAKMRYAMEVICERIEQILLSRRA